MWVLPYEILIFETLKIEHIKAQLADAKTL